MIVIRNMKEAHHQYQLGQLPFRLLQDIALILLGICGREVIDAQDVTNADIDWLLEQDIADEVFMDMLGGNFHVCQCEEDLQQVQGCDFDFAQAHGRWPNVTEVAMSFDACQYLAERSGDPQWAMFLVCWNDSGGPVYYVPQHLWAAARVKEHMALTNQFWNDGTERKEATAPA